MKIFFEDWIFMCSFALRKTYIQMKKTLLLIALAALLQPVAAQNADSVDVLHYNLNLDLGHREARTLGGHAELTVRLLRPCASIGFMFEGAVDSIFVDGERRHCRLDSIGTGMFAAGDTLLVAVDYHSGGYVESYGWGGMHFDNDMYYNLGVAFADDPHSIGRALFPTRDNFSDKATYRLTVTVKEGWSARCGGLLQSATANGDGSTTTVWAIDLPTPPYLVSVAAADWHVIERDFAGVDSTYRATIAYLTQDSVATYHTFDLLDTVVPAFERAFGPYLWHRIGYNATHLGSMEHVMNISLAEQAVGDMSDGAQFGTVGHELAHAWFGNNITCAESGDMWINEGGATFAEEVAFEACRGRDAAVEYYQNVLEQVARRAHIDDGYRALHGIDHGHTYSSYTTYKKGSLAWHSLRGYLGDSLFYSTMKTLFDRYRFANFDAAALRDTLAALSGVNLDEFFDSYIFTPGFWNYHIDSVQYASGRATVHMSRQRLGAEVPANVSSSIPVSLFDWDFSRRDFWVHFSGNTIVATVDLPYRPAFWTIDYGHTSADAATVAEFTTGAAGITDNHLVHFGVRSFDDSRPAHMIVEHHWGNPGGTDQQGIVRPARRYWVVTGDVPFDNNIAGRFHFAESGYGNLNYSELDNGFYFNQSSIDSMALLYRHSAAEPWVVATRRHSNNLLEGFFTDSHLRNGEYILAVVDTNILRVEAVATPSNGGLKLLPNPSGKDFRAEFDSGSQNTPAVLTISDINGCVVYREEGYTSGKTVSHDLPSGIYIVQIKNNFLSLQSQLIVL